MKDARRQRFRTSTGAELSFVTAGRPAAQPILLIHGFPSSLTMFRRLIPRLAKVAYVVAPDLPGFGESDISTTPTFSAFSDALEELLEYVAIGPRYIYLHDYGAPVGLTIAMRTPRKVRGFIIQNANAHESGQGKNWSATKAYWRNPTPENKALATAHLTLAGMREQYVSGVPEALARRIPARRWEKDWRVMRDPRHMAMQRALIADYGRYSETFPAIGAYLAASQPPAVMIWGRHDAFFDLSETLSWMDDLPRMEAHILDASHFLLETHAEIAAKLIVDFLRRNDRDVSRSR